MFCRRLGGRRRFVERKKCQPAQNKRKGYDYTEDEKLKRMCKELKERRKKHCQTNAFNVPCFANASSAAWSFFLCFRMNDGVVFRAANGKTGKHLNTLQQSSRMMSAWDARHDENAVVLDLRWQRVSSPADYFDRRLSTFFCILLIQSSLSCASIWTLEYAVIIKCAHIFTFY